METTEESIGKRIGRRIKELRKKAGYSLEAFSEESEIALGTIGDIEVGKTDNPGIKAIISAADALAISVDELLGRAPPEVEIPPNQAVQAFREMAKEVKMWREHHSSAVDIRVSGKLSADESKLIRIFRQLSTEGRDSSLTIVENRLKQEKLSSSGTT